MYKSAPMSQQIWVVRAGGKARASPLTSWAGLIGVGFHEGRALDGGSRGQRHRLTGQFQSHTNTTMLGTKARSAANATAIIMATLVWRQRRR